MKRMWWYAVAVFLVASALALAPAALAGSEADGGRGSLKIVDGMYSLQVFLPLAPFSRILLSVEEARLIPATDSGFGRQDDLFLSVQIDELTENNLVRRRAGVLLGPQEFIVQEGSAILRTELVPTFVERCEDSGEGSVCGPGDLNDFLDRTIEFTWTWTREDVAVIPFHGFAGKAPNLFTSKGESRSILAGGSGTVLGIPFHGGGKVFQRESIITYPKGADNPPRFTIPFDCAGCSSLRG